MVVLQSQHTITISDALIAELKQVLGPERVLA
jgi:DNA polymerase-3 subunit alpha